MREGSAVARVVGEDGDGGGRGGASVDVRPGAGPGADVAVGYAISFIVCGAIAVVALPLRASADRSANDGVSD